MALWLLRVLWGVVVPTFPKPEPRKRTKARKARTEAVVKHQVRAMCVLRDGYCRLGVIHDITRGHTKIGECFGPSQWTHLPPFTRAQTRNMAPEQRHSTAWTIQACEFHHDRIDGRRWPKLIVTPTTDRGADGPIRVEVK